MPARIHIVDDEPLIAENIKADLTDAGFEVVGMASRVDKALKLFDEIECDAAILDANLAGVSAVTAAAALSRRKIPFIVLSGYTRDQLPFEFAGAEYIQKPYQSRKLIPTLTQILDRYKN